MRRGEDTLAELFAPIADDLEDDETTNIVIQRPGEVGIERAGEWHWRDVPEFDFDRLDAAGMVCAHALGKKFDVAHPVVDSNYGRHRYTAVKPPITLPGTIAVAFRCPREAVNPLRYYFERTAQATVTTNHVDEALLDFYHEKRWPEFHELAVRARKPIGVIGEQHSGKTTFVRSLMQHMPSDDRLITIEENEEFLRMPPLVERNRVTFIYGATTLGAEELVRISLRMRGDRVAIQELRGPEAFAFMQIHQMGQRGTLTTWHGQADDPFTRLRTMIKMHPVGRSIPNEELAATVRTMVDIVVHCSRDDVTHEFLPPRVVYFRQAEQHAA